MIMPLFFRVGIYGLGGMRRRPCNNLVVTDTSAGLLCWRWISVKFCLNVLRGGRKIYQTYEIATEMFNMLCLQEIM